MISGLSSRYGPASRPPSYLLKARKTGAGAGVGPGGGATITRKLHNKFMRRIGLIRQKAVTSFDDITCAICSMVLKDAFELVPCKHSFCNACISGWMQRKTSCPMCRAPIDSFRANTLLQNKADAVCEGITVPSKRLALGVDRSPTASSHTDLCALLTHGMTVQQFLHNVPDSVAAANAAGSSSDNWMEEEAMRIELRLHQVHEEQQRLLRQRRSSILRVHRQFEPQLDRLDREEELLNVELDFYYNR